ncbi:MAG: hemolysin family protein [Phycisphaerales bacterium]
MTNEAWIVVAVLALGLGAVLSCLAQAMRDLSRTTLEEIATIRKSAGGIARVGRILDDVEGHAAAVALPRTVCNLVVTVALVMWIRGLVRPGADAGAGPSLVDDWYLEVVLGIAVSSLVLWVFSTVLPSAVAKHAGEATVYTWSPLLRVAYMIAAPFRPLVRVVDVAVKRLAGKGDKNETELIQDELLSVVEDAKEEGTFDEAERDMIEAVVKFRDRTVAQVMTPRTEIHAMALTNDLGEVTQTIRAIGHSRIPVYEDDLDHIAGIFYVKDLMRWLAGEGSRGGKTFDLKSLLRPALFFPETKTVRELLPELISKRVHIAMVADEFGGTAGLVTIEDIIEEVFGDIHDEYEQPENAGAGVKVDAAARTAEVEGRAYIEDVNAALGAIDVRIPESEEYDTVGGFITVTLGRIPAQGESLAHERVTYTVMAAEPTRVTRVRVQAPEPTPDDGAPRNGVAHAAGG